MTNEEIQIKVDELAVKYNSKVIPVVFKTQEETVVCFLKEISRTAKLRILDSAVTGGFSACENVSR